MSDSTTNIMTAADNATTTSESPTKMAACPKCGAEPTNSAAFCQECGTKICAPPPTPGVEPSAVSMPSETDETAYYQAVFAKFEANGGEYTAKGTLNLVACILGPLWYAWKGMWVKAIALTIFFGICYMVLAQLGQPMYVASFAVMGFALAAGNYDYFLLRRRNTQWYYKPSRQFPGWLVNLRNLVKHEDNTALAWANKHPRAVGFAAVFLLNYAFISCGDILQSKAAQRAETAEFYSELERIYES